MPTLIHIDGFEAAITWGTNSSNGGGLATTVANGAAFTHDTGTRRSGSYSLKVVQPAGSATRISKTLTTGIRTLVGSVYFYCAAAPSVQSIILDSGSGPRPTFRLETDGRMSALFNSGTAQSTAGSVCDAAWHRLDFYADTATTNSFFLDWQIDAVAQTRATRALTAQDIPSFQIGSAGTTPTATFFLDDLVLSATAADYPIGEHTVFGVSPTGDGTHVNTNGGMENDAGTDITTTAWQLVDNWPPSSTAFLRQSVIGTTDYAEVTFANHDATMTTIWDAQALLAYTASTSAANEGATIVSFDSFSTFTEVYGNPTTRADYTSASTTAFFYKVSNSLTPCGVITRPGGGWTTTDFDNLKARMGYSGDVTGNPRWNALMIQYAGTISGGGGGGGGDADSLGDLLI